MQLGGRLSFPPMRSSGLLQVLPLALEAVTAVVVPIPGLISRPPFHPSLSLG